MQGWNIIEIYIYIKKEVAAMCFMPNIFRNIVLGAYRFYMAALGYLQHVILLQKPYNESNWWDSEENKENLLKVMVNREWFRRKAWKKWMSLLTIKSKSVEEVTQLPKACMVSTCHSLYASRVFSNVDQNLANITQNRMWF